MSVLFELSSYISKKEITRAAVKDYGSVSAHTHPETTSIHDNAEQSNFMDRIWLNN